MDVFVKYLVKFGFSRIRNNLKSPIVVHCVPGAGKSSVIRALIREDCRFIAYTLGVPDHPHISGAYIRPYEEPLPKDKFVLLDEYTLGDSIPQGVFAVFGDPCQSSTGFCVPADFVGKVSKRFGSRTAALLQALGFEVEATGEDEVLIEEVFEGEPIGEVIYHEPEVGCLLASHSVEAKSISEVQGQTYEIVTYVTASNYPEDRVAAFQCLTRHRSILKILCPNATYASP